MRMNKMSTWNFSTKEIHTVQGLDNENRAISQPIIPEIAYSFNDIDNGKCGNEKGTHSLVNGS